MQFRSRFKAIVLLISILFSVHSAHSENLTLITEHNALANEIRNNPSNYDATYRFVKVSIDLHDYEAAIGALERLLLFNPKLIRAHHELGHLYARLGAYEMSAYHINMALQSGSLDKKEAARLENQLPEIEKRTQAVRFSGQLIAGLRSQSNANFFPSNGLFQIGGIGYRSLLGQRPDMNAFQLAQAAHDYDLDTEYQASIETRLSTYATQQYNLTLYNVTLFGGSTGVRVAIPQLGLPGATVKPYLLGTSSLLGNQSYLNAGGGGITFSLPINPDIYLDPGMEIRSLYVNRDNTANGGRLFSTVSTLATGDAITGYISGSYQVLSNIKLEGRAAFTRANANIAVQSSDQIDIQTMLRMEYDAPLEDIGGRWAVSPYVRFTHLAFDKANSIVDPWIARRDAAWMGGAVFDAPITPHFGFVGTVEFAQNLSNITNFQAQNFSISFGPSARF